MKFDQLETVWMLSNVDVDGEKRFHMIPIGKTNSNQNCIKDT
jgi:hypothetical protein